MKYGRKTYKIKNSICHQNSFETFFGIFCTCYSLSLSYENFAVMQRDKAFVIKELKKTLETFLTSAFLKVCFQLTCQMVTCINVANSFFKSSITRYSGTWIYLLFRFKVCEQTVGHIFIKLKTPQFGRCSRNVMKCYKIKSSFRQQIDLCSFDTLKMTPH